MIGTPRGPGVSIRAGRWPLITVWLEVRVRSSIAPGPVLLGHADNQLLDSSVNPRPARGSTFLRPIELASDEPSVPSQDGIRQGGSRHLAKRLAAQPMSDFAQLRSLAIRELQPPVQLAPQDAVFCSQIF